MVEHNGVSINCGGCGGVSLSVLLTLVFITLKLTSVVDWSWIWVLSPLWAPIVGAIAITFGVLGILLLIAIVAVPFLAIWALIATLKS